MIAAVVLSAGKSSRMGRPKALLPVDAGTETFLQRIVRSCREAGAGLTVVAIGPPHGVEIRAAWSGDQADLAWAENPDPSRGMLSSVQEAVRRLPAEAEGALIWPVDVPFVQSATVRQLLSARDRLVVPTMGCRGGHPIWVPRKMFAELLSLPHQVGLRQLRQDHPEALSLLPVADAAVLRDVDTLADLRDAIHDS